MSTSIYPVDSKHNFSFQGINEIDANVKQVPTTQLSTSTSAVSTSLGTKILIISAVVITLAAVGVGVGLGLSKSNKNDSNNNNNDIHPNPTPAFTCDDNPYQCQGVPASVSNYIMSTYTDAGEIRSLLQLSRSVSAIPVNATRDNQTAAFRDLSNSIQCMAFTMPGTFATAYQDLVALQFNNEAAVESYLSMNQAFSGQPISLTPPADLAANCQFNTSARLLRRLQSSTSTNCSTESNVLIYVSGPGSSPSRTINQLNQIQSLVSNTTSSLFDSVLSISPSRIDGNTNFSMDTLSRILNNSNNSSRFTQGNSSRLDILQSIRLMVDSAATTSRIPSSISLSQYNELSLEFMQTYLSNLHSNIANYDIQQHVNFVTNHLNQGKRIVLVSHGQNTQYANQLFNRIGASLRSSVSLVYVAPTVSSIPGNNSASYITNPSDRAASRVQEQASAGRAQTPLPANTGNATFNRNNTLRSRNRLGSSEYDDDTEMNHDFRGYLNFYRNEIYNLIESGRNRAVQPTRTMGNGLITAALNWDSQPDLDLHIFEPNYHIYYSSRTGNNGFLDVDDTNGYGPQHYYTGCTLQTGNYTFKVNYYSGGAPSTATLSVSAGSQFYTKQFVLDHSIASSGNANPPYEICTVTVTRSPYSNNYLFSITHP